MLDITMLLDISAMLTAQVTTIICHHMKKIIIKRKIKIWRIRPKLICYTKKDTYVDYTY